MTSLPPLGPFERAREKVWNNLTEGEKNELTGACTIEDVWEIAKSIQKNQGKRRELGNMNKIRPYLEGLKRYDDAIKFFISSNPAHAALIWVGFTLLNSTVLTNVVTLGPNQVLVAGLVPLTSNGWLCLWKTGREQLL